MKVISVNVSRPCEIEWSGRKVTTSIFKEPVAGRVFVRSLNLDGDSQADLIAHGGEHRAVMVYQIQSYQYWRSLLKKDLKYGQFGENLTVDGLADDQVCIGDHFQVGSAIFEVTQPRVTCFKVGISTGIPEMPALLVAHHRPGFYMRVIKEGEVCAGDIIRKIKAGEEQMSITRIDSLLYLKDHPTDELEKAIKINALSQGWRTSFLNLLNTFKVGSLNGNAGLTDLSSGQTAWSGFQQFFIRHIQIESNGVKSFEFARLDGTPSPNFLAGQYIAVRIPSKDTVDQVIRTYSLCGPPSSDNLRIAVKRECNGIGSAYMHDLLKEGDIIEISAPRGAFTLSNNNSPLVFLCAGIGITPLISMLYSLAHQRVSREILFINSIRNGDYEIFRSEIRSLAKQLSSFNQLTIFSAPGQTEHKGVDYDIEGHLDLHILSQQGLQPQSEYYICGPSKYIQNTLDALKIIGIPEKQIKLEQFVSDPLQFADQGKIAHLPILNDGHGALVTFAKSKISFRWSPHFGNLLEAAEACDVPVKWSCRTGVCHRCETGLIDGEITYLSEPLSPAADANVLICSAVPKGAITLDL
ncbi:MOSC and FAD-binding oxidoreductase domain-containing protein [Dyadobacter sp. 3J3]|uniref:MOSC and FAD-binding oxidoreductase domain-containing protein n=1 Tax=Dyadobacter sp. 3J3 TaxID=2606600 RepID=UPI00135ADEEE|nr:MOSC and FAD-binding oxidoreductase domain-containing protein [Dyadobacter sp. 3J3]